MSEPARAPDGPVHDSEGPVRLLYMEDDVGLARLLQKRLERAGFEVTLAHDGDEGLRLYEQGDFDVVAVDHSMPGRAGLEVIRVLARNETLPPTIMVAGSGDERIAVEAMKLGASDYIVKDVAGNYLELLPSVIERALAQHRLQEEMRRAERERETLIVELRAALAQVETLSGLLPICTACKKIRDDAGYWHQIETYFAARSNAQFSHGICPDCVKELYPDTTSAHAYVGAEDLVSPLLLCLKLREGADPVSRYLQQEFSAGTRRMLQKYEGVGEPPSQLVEAVIDELNRLIGRGCLYDEERFRSVSLAPELRDQLTDAANERSLARLDRQLLEAAYPNEIRQSRLG